MCGKQSSDLWRLSYPEELFPSEPPFEKKSSEATGAMRYMSSLKSTKLLCQLWNPVQPELDHIGIECGKILWRNIFFMTDNPEPGMLPIQPWRKSVRPSRKRSGSPRGRNTLRLETSSAEAPSPGTGSLCFRCPSLPGKKTPLLRFHFESFPSTHNITKSILVSHCAMSSSLFLCSCARLSALRPSLAAAFISHVLHLSNSSFVTLPSR